MTKSNKRIKAFELPEGCIATVLSRTTPVDVGKLSMVSKTFRSAADSDTVWNRFLEKAISQYPSLSNSPNKKALYMALSDRPIIINHGKKVFFLINYNFSNIRVTVLRVFLLQ